MYAITAGCSHTKGTGNAVKECYTSFLEQHYKFNIVNLGIDGGNANTTLMSIVRAIKTIDMPEFIVAQWPNPLRLTIWSNHIRTLQNVNSHNDAFKELLKNGEENFYEPWMQSIIIANLLCDMVQIPIINIFIDSLESFNQGYLQCLNENGIMLHVDEKIPGKTWLFDSAASDGIHHSPWCHRQWAERLIGLIDESTN